MAATLFTHRINGMRSIGIPRIASPVIGNGSTAVTLPIIRPAGAASTAGILGLQPHYHRAGARRE
jgi:hypothetical protein